MTVILAHAKDGIVWMGADSNTSNGYTERTTANDKVFMVSKSFLVGVAGSIRASQLIRYCLEPTPREQEVSDLEYIVRLAGQIQQLYRQHAVLTVENGVEQSDSSILIGYRGHIYHIFTNFGVERYESNTDGIGTGGEVGLGALTALIRFLPPEEALRDALHISEISSGVRGPMVIKRLPPLE